MTKTTHGAFWTDLHIALNVVGHSPRRIVGHWAPRYHRSKLRTGHAKFTFLNKMQVFELRTVVLVSIEVCKVEHVSRNNFGERGDNEPAVLRASGTMPMSDPVFLNKSSGWGPPRMRKYSIPVIHPDSVANYRPNAHSHQISTRLEQYPSCKLHAGPTKHFARSKASPGHAYPGPA